VGATAFEQQRFADAAREFERAYDLEPAWQVLYNLGTVYAALGRPVDAIEAFERYLKLGGPDVDGGRRSEVTLEIARQHEKSGWLDVHVNRTGAQIRIDGHAAGVTPLAAAVLVAVGVHSVEVIHGDQHFERNDVRVGSAKRTTLEVDFPPPLTAAPSASKSSKRESSKVHQLGNPQRAMGWVFGGAGLLAGVIAAVAIVSSTADLHSADPVSSKAENETERRVGFVFAGAAGALLVTGVLSYVLAPTGVAAPESARAAFEVSGWASASSGGLTLKRRWQ
jgi:tetratricopeptide (TPR) repeat protein